MARIYHNPELRQINFLDERFYQIDGTDKYFPSVTTVLDVYPKGYGFNEWLKSVGMNAEIIVDRAAKEGSKIHDGIERVIGGEKLKWLNENGKENYNETEWLSLLKFQEFWKRETPEILAVECRMISHKHKLGMTVDLVCRFRGLIWLIDHKSSNYLHTSQELQLSAYATVWNHHHPDLQIDKTAILHLKAGTRGADKKDKVIQGKGWQLVEFERPYQDAYRIFEAVRVIWDEENPNYKPKNIVYPDFISLYSEGELPMEIPTLATDVPPEIASEVEAFEEQKNESTGADIPSTS